MTFRPDGFARWTHGAPDVARELAREWKLLGPEPDKLSLAEVAVILGYEDAASIRRLVAEGKLPAPRGLGANQYYTGLDVAVILEMFGRWQPAPTPAARASEGAPKRAKASENAQERESQD